jgi:large subunit ribosomal protein L21
MKYAIVESGGKQFKAVEGGTLEVDRLQVDAGQNIKLEQVLLLADGETVTVGTPLVKDSPVWARVLAHIKGPKVTIFNYSPKKRIRVKTGHRQNYTRLLVEQIGGAELVKRAPAKVETAAEAKADKRSRSEKAAKPAKKAAPAPKAAKKPAAAAAPKAAPKQASKAAAKAAPAAKPAASKAKPAAAKKPAGSKGAASKGAPASKAKKPAAK